MSWSTFRDRWQLFVGAMVTVCLGVALMQVALLAVVAVASPDIPAGLAPADERALREGYDGATALMGMMMLLSGFIAVFIVSSTFAFTVAQRRRDLALLRLVGASRTQVRRLLLGEALVLGLLGSGAGVVAGIPLAGVQASVLVRLGFVPDGFSIAFRVWAVPLAIGVGVAIALLGVFGASRRAAKVRPLEALRNTGSATRVMTVGRWIRGVLFLVCGLVTVVVLPAIGGEAALALSTLVCILLVVAFSSLSPLMVPLVGRVLGLFAGATPLGRTAHANLRDGVRRSATTAAPVLVLAGLVVGLGGTLDALVGGGRAEARNTLTGDLVVTADRPVLAELAKIDGVRAVSEETPVRFDFFSSDPDVPDAEPISAIAIDPVSYRQTHHLPLAAGSLADLSGPTIAVSSSYSPEENWRVGGTMRVRIGGQKRDLRIVALLPTRVAGPDFLVPAGLVPDADGPGRYVVTSDGPGVADRIRGAGLGEVFTVDEWIRAEVGRQQNDNGKVMIALLGMAALYTAIAMVNAVVIAAADRSAEFATARLSGFTRRQVVLMALWESLAVTTVGLLLGGAAAAGTVGGVSAAVSTIVGERVLSIPWGLCAGIAAGAGSIMAVASVLTTLAATREAPVRLVAARE